MDTISCGSTIAFAMECYEKGLIPQDDTGGIELTWGNKEALVKVVEQIAMGEGIGKLLGQGTRKVAGQLGGGSMDFAVQVKGLELPMHDPRAFFSWASNYATSPRGGCHLHGMSAIYENSEDPIPEWGLTGYYPRHSNAGKGKITRLAQNWAHILNSMVICYFATFTQKPSKLAALINHATGYELTPHDLLVIGDRINALHRAYNYRCGIRREDDRLPVRSLTPLAEGGAADQVPDLEYQFEEYYLGFFIGSLHGLYVTKLHMHGFLITLVTMGLARGFILVITNAFPITGLPRAYNYLGQGYVFNAIPVPVIICLIIAGLAFYLLRFTYIGRQIYAAGSNIEAARYSGVNVDARIMLCYIISVVCASIVGIIQAARMSLGHPGSGEGYELLAITACIPGGLSLMGGEGGVLGILAGALLIGVLQNEMVMLNINPYWHRIVISLVLLAAITLDYVRRRRRT